MEKRERERERERERDYECDMWKEKIKNLLK